MEWWPEAAAVAARIATEYAGQRLGLTDASLIALAARLDTIRLATFDERHFRAVRPASGAGSFELLPLDS